jgi:hypothetical protein
MQVCICHRGRIVAVLKHELDMLPSEEIRHLQCKLKDRREVKNKT